MKEFINNLLEKYVYYHPTVIEDYKTQSLNIDDKRALNTSSEPMFDPHFGFPRHRKPRVALATPEEVFSAQVPNKNRDYCAHHYIRYKACRRDNMFAFFGCMHYKEELGHCLIQDTVILQKEYERENRLLQRNRRIKRMEMGLAN